MLSPQSKPRGIANTMFVTVLLVATIQVLTGILVYAVQEYTPQEECGLYLAPSSIPGAGLGMYSGSKAYIKHELVSDGDIMIPEWDMDFNNGDDDYYNLWNEYTWSASMIAGLEDDAEDVAFVSLASPGFGAAINCMLPLINVQDEHWEEEVLRMTRSGVTSDSPGAGAFTTITGRRFVAKKAIEPFSELYANYGEEYFAGRSAYNSVPFKKHYGMADHLIKSFIANVTSWQKEPTTDEGILHGEDFEDDLWNFIVGMRDIWDKSRTMFALPSQNSTAIEGLRQLLDGGGSRYQHYNNTVKNQEWMDENGQCMDNIRDGISKIPHAGRGAFANRLIRKGELVSPAPLIHLPNSSSYMIYDHIKDATGQWKRNKTSPSGYQLMLNYCFGHRDSTLLLCPYGYLNLNINHNHKNPNTKVVWTDNKRMRHPEWLDIPLQNWTEEWHSGLALDYIALRDITQGEEITIDYGIEWETAWQEHVRRFDTPRKGYKPSYELNEIIDLKIPTIFEPIEAQFQGVTTFCRSYFFPERHKFTPHKFGTSEDDDTSIERHYTCRVLMRHDDDNMYTVEIFHRESRMAESDFYESHFDTPEYVLFNVPRDAIFFRDMRYSRDHHQPWVFRHEMRLPDDIFPEVWKNRKRAK